MCSLNEKCKPGYKYDTTTKSCYKPVVKVYEKEYSRKNPDVKKQFDNSKELLLNHLKKLHEDPFKELMLDPADRFEKEMKKWCDKNPIGFHWDYTEKTCKENKCLCNHGMEVGPNVNLTCTKHNVELCHECDDGFHLQCLNQGSI